MTLEVSRNEASNVLPLCREELFTELVQKKIYGRVHEIWQHPGHIFVAVNDGHKLFTFDCKPVTKQHAFDSGQLDMSLVPSPIVNIIMTTDDTALIICLSSHTYLCKFENDATWSRLAEFDLSSFDHHWEVISSCYLPRSQSLVWCQRSEDPVSPELSPSGSQLKSSSNKQHFRVCKMRIDAVTVSNSLKQENVDVIMYNCPPFEVVQLTEDIVFLTSSHAHDQVTCHVLFNVTSRALRLMVGERSVEKPLSSYLGATDFQDLALTCVDAFIKVTPGKGDLGICCDNQRKQVGSLSSSGELELFSYVKSSTETSSWSVKRQVRDVSQHLSKMLPVDRGLWFLCRGCLGVVAKGNLYVIRLKDNALISECDGMAEAQRVVVSHSPAILALVLTDHSLLALQTSNKRRGKEAPDMLPKDSFFQADIMRLAQLHQEKMKTFDIDNVAALKQLQEAWTVMKTSQGCSQLTQSVAPYLDEYWKLENLSQSLLDMTLAPPEGSTSHPLVPSALAPAGESRAGRVARLVWLSQVAPQALLDHLCQGISVDSERVQESELKAWQTLLGLEGGDLTNFEFLCRLLFLLHPEKLFNFVKCAESASEQTVGVSAFVRKKQSLVFYKAANDSLPEYNTSCNPQAAELARSQLIIASGSEDRVGVALGHLLGAGLWASALDLLSQAKVDGCPGLAGHLYTTMQAMTQSSVLPEYTKLILPIIPSWKSFIAFAEIAGLSPSVRQQQLSLSAGSVFANEQDSLPLIEAKPFLLDLISKIDKL